MNTIIAKPQERNERSPTGNINKVLANNHSIKCCDLCNRVCPNSKKTPETESKLCPLFSKGCKIKNDGECVELVPLFAKRKRPVTRSGKVNYDQLCCLQKFLLHLH